MTKLTLGPLLYHWPAARRRDFYAKIADEAPFDSVYLGEVVCGKRLPWYEKDLPEIAERLRRAGKEVVFSTPALVSERRDVALIERLCAAGETVEINDLAALPIAGGKPFVCGPLLNVFNEGALDVVRRFGASRIGLPIELSRESIAHLAAHNAQGETEVLVFGREPLAIAQRCYHARAFDLHKDNCQFVCESPADGLEVTDLDGRPLLALNGTQILSYAFVAPLDELVGLAAAGVSHFRLSSQSLDMPAIARVYRDILDHVINAEEGLVRLRAFTGALPLVDGYVHGNAGMVWQAATRAQAISAQNASF